MNYHASKNRYSQKELCMKTNQAICLTGQRILINCLKGALYVTYPNSSELTLKAGNHTFVDKYAKVCILSLADSELLIEQKKSSGLNHKLKSAVNRLMTFL